MAVKVLIKRRFKEKFFKEIDDMIKKHRYGAMNQEGYISSETLWDAKDPFTVVVASNWRSLREWNIWKNSAESYRKGGRFDPIERFVATQS